jgi:hypothetical protein
MFLVIHIEIIASSYKTKVSNQWLTALTDSVRAMGQGVKFVWAAAVLP